jgi:hypothetical protein
MLSNSYSSAIYNFERAGQPGFPMPGHPTDGRTGTVAHRPTGMAGAVGVTAPALHRPRLPTGRILCQIYL